MSEDEIYGGIKKCCFTGYRPSKFPFSLSRGNNSYEKFENAVLSKILCLVKSGCRTFYSGMAMGFDIIAAELVLTLKSAYNFKDIKLICVLPYREQGESFSFPWRERFDNILSACDEKIVLSEEYHSGCYQQRNKFMVDSSDCVLTWYDGRAGGTRNTIDYALRKKRFVINTFEKNIDGFGIQTSFEIM